MEVHDNLYQAIVHRSHQYDGMIFIGIRTTRIVCLPSCRSRIPKRANIEPFATLNEALQHGYRPCKRCRPEGQIHPSTALTQDVVRLVLSEFPRRLTLSEVAQRLNVSARHISRTLQRDQQISYRECRNGIWEHQARILLANEDETIVAVASKLQMTPSYFARWFVKRSGMTPTQFRNQPTHEETPI